MRRLAIAWVLLVGLTMCLDSPPAQALTLKVAPLEYRTTLSKGEKKKGYIDVGNPTKEAVKIKTSVRAFTQLDDQGTLRFYDDEQVRAGVLLDLDEFELGPREAVRMYFLLDGTRLPTGDVFGAIFFTLTPVEATTGVAQSIRLGTLLSVVNGTPGQRRAEVDSLNVGLFHLGDRIHGSYAIKNTGDPTRSSGFYPSVTLSVSPWGDSQTASSKLVFAGRTRQNDFTLQAPPLGIYKLSAAFGDSVKTRWVVVVHPLVLVVVVSLLLITPLAKRFYARKKAPLAAEEPKT